MNTTFHTPDDLAAMLHRSKRTIQRWARERRIPSVLISGTRLFTSDQVQEIVAAYSIEPVDPQPEADLENPAYRESRVVVSIDPKHRRPPAA
jgi:hypothetical protein